ncbi:MAG: hypothetical protein KI790_00370 [Cyclobacteriaceae bacterium]|nr:hypothetical protein [Cyclobacteriaceae bacterium HetDA_MAG_MS6]
MENAFSTALSLLGVGMITVFVVLALVVLVGNVLISFVNRFSPQVELPKTAEIDSARVAAITTAVEIFTKGKGRITKIEKH